VNLLLSWGAADAVVAKINHYWADKEILLSDDVPLSIKISIGLGNYPIDTIEPPVLLKIALESLKES
jgi:hypothetical protein